MEESSFLLFTHPRRKTFEQPKAEGEEEALLALPSFTTLPGDYLRLVEETFDQVFQKELLELRRERPAVKFQAEGWIYSNELTFSVCLGQEEALEARSFHTSFDFQPPEASGPFLEKALEVLEVLVSFYFEGSPSPLPEEWSLWEEVQGAASKHPSLKVFVKVDRRNSFLEKEAVRWLSEKKF